MDKKIILNKFKNQLIVSCQAVDGEPLNDSYVISKMAYACYVGGAKCLRVSQIDHIKAIKKIINLPLIGLYKKHYENSDVVISPSINEVEKLCKLNLEIVAIDATLRKRPKESLEEIVRYVKNKYPHQILMADCATLKEALNAQKLGFDIIGTTLRGYTKETKNNSNLENNYEFIKTLLKEIKTPIIAEGGIWSPKQAKDIKNLGVFGVVVGSAITRPHLITKNFLDTYNK